jgi:GWxTD domain-containing protein
MKIVWLGLALVMATQVLAQDELQNLSPEHRKWLEEEVVYIITDREREVFLTLETFEERERLIEAFWRRRDPDRATPENEFKDEHYRRLEFANTTFSRHTSRPGWKTDQGRMYIILGEPNEKQRYEGTSRDLAHTQLWFYSGDTRKAQPAFFVLLFYKPLNVGEYRLYSPGMDGPLSLLHGKEQSETNVEAIERLIEISPDLATASLTIDLGDPPDYQSGRASLGADMVLGHVEDSPKRLVRTDYVDAWLRYGKKVSAEYSFNFVPSRSSFAVLAGPGAIPFVHYSIELDPQYFILATEDKTKYYTTLDISLEVTDPEGNVVIGNDKEVYVELTPGQIQQFDAAPFAYQDDFPLLPGDYKVSVFLKNRIGEQYTVVEEDLKVDPFSPDKPGLSDVVLGFRSELMDDGANEGELRTFQIGKHRIHPAADNVVTLGEEAHVFFQAVGVTPDYGLRLTLVDGEQVLQEFSARVGDYQGGPVEHSFRLTGMAGGRYPIRAQLLDPSGTMMAEKSTTLAVSPRSAIPRPWIHRRSFNVMAPGLLAMALGEQLIALERYEEARRALEAAVAADNPDLASARWRLAGLYLGWREVDRVVELLLPLKETHPNQYEVVAGLGFAFYIKNDPASALEYLERARTLRPPTTSLLNALGDCYERLGQPEKAKEVFQRSLELDPEQKPIQERLAPISEGG